jgi:hypothetical protein
MYRNYHIQNTHAEVSQKTHARSHLKTYLFFSFKNIFEKIGFFLFLFFASN